MYLCKFEQNLQGGRGEKKFKSAQEKKQKQQQQQQPKRKERNVSNEKKEQRHSLDRARIKRCNEKRQRVRESER